VNTFLRKPGAWYDPSSSNFLVWAPFRESVDLLLARPGSYPDVTGSSDFNGYAMEKVEDGYWKINIPVPAGTRYFYRLDGEVTCPDPASLSQPDGVHGASELVDRFDFHWSDQHWEGIPLSTMIIYELHTGVFSPTHDFEGVIQKLEYLAGLGINTIELMPLGQFPGSRNWGYDGVYPFAVQNSYGGFRGFQRLVDAAHAKGIAVLVDVIYNHFGPEGNYIGEYGPYFTDKYKTGWGEALNFDDAGSDGVRTYFLENARMWLEDYHADGLRLDAVHAIFDSGAVHFMQQLKERVSDVEHRTERRKILIAEIDLNNPRYINPPEKGGYGLDGQWIDEFHHALRTLLTGDKSAYYEDFGSIADLEKAFRNTYVYDGVYSVHRRRTFGGKADANPYSQFVVFAQNHDHVGNRAFGDRLTTCLSIEELKLAAAAVLLSPYVPMLFMGEEYGGKNPFQFFVDFSDPSLIDSVRKGRSIEFQGFAAGHELPDPQSPQTFDCSVLSWEDRSDTSSGLLEYYRRLIGLRKSRPALQGVTRDSMTVHPSDGMVLSFERKILGDQLFIWLHFGSQPVSQKNNTGEWLNKIFDSASSQWMGPGELAFGEIPPGSPIELAPYSVAVFEKKV
jgi:maltooligosyltrehalose trehalohydrolase